MRRRMLGSLGGWKNPYQTFDNALIFMADAEWNVGLFKHSNEKRIVDLVSGIEATVPESYSFDKKSITNIGSTSSITFRTGVYHSGEVAVEACSCLLSKPTAGNNFSGGQTFKRVSVGLWRRPVSDGCCGIIPCSFPSNGKVVYYGFPGMSRAREEADTEVFGVERTRLLNSAIPNNGIIISAYINGKLIVGTNTMTYTEAYTPSSNVTFGTYGSSSGMRFRSMRAYSRHLTDDEAKRNYEIDKERFGLQ